MKKRYLSLLLSFSAMWCVAQTPVAQINTPMPTVPFGSNSAYEFGALPTNLPTGGQYGGSQDAADAYVDFVNDWVEYCGSDRARIKWSSTDQTVSEGIAYGMLLAVYAGDKDLTDRLWAYYKSFMNARGVMDWKTQGCNSVIGSNGASDAEFDVAMALIIADYQWPGTTSPHNYKTDADALILNILDWEVDYVSNPPNQLSNGDGWLGYAAGGGARTGSNSSRNPSYQCPAYIPEWKDYYGQEANNFDNILAATYTLLTNNVHPTSGLSSDWCSPDGTPSTNNFADESSRFPWRMGVDVLWHNSSVAKGFCDKMTVATTTGGNTPFNSNGSTNYSSPATSADPNVIYTSGWLSSTMAAGTATQQNINDFYTATVDDDEPYYFQSCLRALGLFVGTGNFWRPGHEVGQCSRPDLGADISICGSSSIELVSGLPTGQNKTFTWRRGTQIVSGPSSTANTYTATQAGVYEVEVDSANGECVVTDVVEILGVLPSIDLGADINLCTPPTATLDAAVSGSGINYQWEQDNNVLSLETGQTLMVTEAGIYDITISATGCQSQTDQIEVTSDLPEVMGGSTCTPGPVTLEVLSAGGPYEWYAGANGGPVLNTGDTYTPSISQTTTYYVADGGSISQTVGELSASNSLSSPQNAGTVGINFTAETAFTIDEVTLVPYVYNCNPGDMVYVNLDLIDVSSGTNVIASSQTVSIACTGVQSVAPFDDYYTVALETPLAVPSAGSYRLAPSSGGNQLVWFQDGSNYGNLTYPGVLDITGDTRSDKTGSFPGIWDIKVSTGNTCDRAPVVAEIDCATGIMSSELNMIKIFPNPFEQNVMIEAKSESLNVNIVSSIGEIMETLKLSAFEAQEAGAALPAGTYLIECVTSSGLRQTERLVKY